MGAERRDERPRNLKLRPTICIPTGRVEVLRGEREKRVEVHFQITPLAEDNPFSRKKKSKRLKNEKRVVRKIPR